MTHDGESKPGPWRRLRVPAVAVVAVVAVFAWALQPPSMRPLDDEMARLRAAGLPTTCAEAIGDMPPDAENGALDVEAAIAALETSAGKPGTWTVTGPWDSNATGPWQESATPEQWTQLRAFLDRERPFFDRVDAGLTKPRFRFPDTLDVTGAPSEAYVGRSLVPTMQLLMTRAAAGGTAQDRVAAMSSLARLGRRIEATSLVPVMFGAASMGGAIREARNGLEDGSISAADLRRALDPELRESLLGRLPHAAPLQAVWTATVFRAYCEGKMPQFAVQRSWSDRLRRSVKRITAHDARVELDELRPAQVAEAVRSWADVAGLDTSSVVRLHAAVVALDARTPSDPGGVLRIVRRLARKLAELESATALARVALAVAERRAATGAWPASLDDLRDAFPDGVPLDRFTDAPFVYDPSGAKVRLASAGAFPDDNTPADPWLHDTLLLWELPR